MDCQNCELVRENEKLRKFIERQQQAINAAQNFCLHIYSRASGVLCRRSGVPRGIWAFWKGSGGVARKVYNLLKGVEA